jgi:hypothetical protein
MIAVGFMIVVTLPVVIFLPIYELQAFFWATAFVTLLIGDSVTTSLFKRYGLQEANGPVRWICGAQPGIVCIFSTRAMVLIVAGTLYLAVIQFRIGLTNSAVAITVLSIPVVLATGGFAATILNSYGIYLAAIENRKQP